MNEMHECYIKKKKRRQWQWQGKTEEKKIIISVFRGEMFQSCFLPSNPGTHHHHHVIIIRKTFQMPWDEWFTREWFLFRRYNLQRTRTISDLMSSSSDSRVTSPLVLFYLQSNFTVLSFSLDWVDLLYMKRDRAFLPSLSNETTFPSTLLSANLRWMCS